MTREAVLPRSRGFTLVEMLMVVVLIGIMLTVALPYFRGSTGKGAVRGAVDAIVSLHSVAKTVAVQRGRTTRLVMSAGNGTMVVVANKVGTTTGVDTIGRVENLNNRFEVTFTTTRDTLLFSPRGVGLDPGTTTIIVSKGTARDTVTISAGGRLFR